ncbi:MAG: patatin-like phospholipase family protein [bacterium]
MNKRAHKIALCLTGGGISGSMYEVGCLKALDEALDVPGRVNEFDIFVGISAGAVISALIANGYTAREIYEGITSDGESGLDFKRKNIYDLRWSEVFKTLAPLFKRLPALVRYGWVNRKYASFMDLLSIMQEFIPPGLFSLNNLDKYMAGLFYPEGKTNDFRNLEKELYIPATILDSGRRLVFGEDDDTVPISKAVAASAAIPIFFRPFSINGYDLIDGSTGQVSHIDIAIRNGARLVIIINPTVPFEHDENKLCLPTFNGHCGTVKEKGMGLISDQARRIETKTRFEFGLKAIKKEHPNIDIVVLQPTSSDGVLFLTGVMDFESRKNILNYGYYSTLAELRLNALKYDEIFKKHQIKLRSEILEST